MVVNTSKTGQFVMPYNLDYTGGRTHEDDPWYQVLNYPNVRNISYIKRQMSGKPKSIRIKVNATEDYVRAETQGAEPMGPADSFSVTNDDIFGGTDPQFNYTDRTTAAAGSSTAAKTLAGRFSMGRRRFRWTKQWLLWENSNGASPTMYLWIRNDLKFAHGVQVMIKAGTYWRSTLPYFNTSINVNVEFRGRLLQRLNPQVAIGDRVLFPYTNATFATTN